LGFAQEAALAKAEAERLKKEQEAKAEAERVGNFAGEHLQEHPQDQTGG